MKIKLLLVTTVIALAASSAASADSNHRYKSDRNQSFGVIEHHDHRAVDRHNRLFSFSLIVPGPSYYMPHRSYSHYDYRNDYRYRHNHKHHHEQHRNNHNGKHHDRGNIQGFRGTR